ncbi:MAG: diguanylate cyclase [Gemmatimonadota bacterium]
MTSPAPNQRTLSTFTPLAEGASAAGKFREPSTDVREALARDQTELRREVVLWQRWVRYLALFVVLGATALFSEKGKFPVAPLAVVAIIYVSIVFLSGVVVQKLPRLTSKPWLRGMIVTSDLSMVGALVYLTGMPQVSQRFLIVALLFVPLAAFYFGAWLGVYATLLSAVIYLLIGEILPPFVAGPRPVSSATNVALFALVAVVLTYTFGSFRVRMDELRRFCKLVEEGDLVSGMDLTKARFPDDLTLLARSFEKMRAGLADQIGTDPLTGCLNRRSLEARLRADWRLAKRRSTHIAVVAVDLDHFKQINDTRGHPVGDMVLQQLTGIMKATARDTDSVARFGGDEFVLVLPDTGWQGALTFAERLRRRVDDFTFGPPGSPMMVTVSVGVALARGTDPISPEDLLKEADRSLYKAKQQGRNRVFA